MRLEQSMQAWALSVDDVVQTVCPGMPASPVNHGSSGLKLSQSTLRLLCMSVYKHSLHSLSIHVLFSNFV